MADQPKKKPTSQRVRNDERRNGKAKKNLNASRNRKYRPSELQKALWNQGAMRRIMAATRTRKREETDDSNG